MNPPPSARAAAPAAKSLTTANESQAIAAPDRPPGPGRVILAGQRGAEQDRAADHRGDQQQVADRAAAAGRAGERAGGDREPGALTGCEEEIHGAAGYRG